MTTPLVVLNASTAGNITMTLSTNTIVSYDYINGTQIYPGQGSINLRTGQNLLIQKLVLSSPVTSTITLNGQYSYSPTSGVTYYYRFTETINPPTSNVMNLLNGQQTWHVTHYYVTNTKGYPPTYYGPGSTSNYWGGSTSSITQPVLDLTPPTTPDVAAGMFWNETYAGNPVTITILGTYSSGTSPPGTGYYTYFFVMENNTASKNWHPVNYTSKNTSFKSGTIAGGNTGPTLYGMLNPVIGGVSNYYVVIQWTPQGNPHQWVVYVIQEWDGNIKSHVLTGTGVVKPSPGDYILICVTYYPSNKTFIGYAIDLNNGQESYFSYQLTSYYFTPPNQLYAFGIEAETEKGDYANWATTYINYQG